MCVSSPGYGWRVSSPGYKCVFLLLAMGGMFLLLPMGGVRVCREETSKRQLIDARFPN